MRKATRVTVSTMGALDGVAGIEHGIGEVLQGSVAPDGVMILSWPDSELYAILAGEPAMTIVPNLLVTGILAILLSLAVLVWATVFIQSWHGSLILALLTLAMLLAGGGFGPPLLGIMVAIAATGMDVRTVWFGARVSAGLRGFLSMMWPLFFASLLAAWLMLIPGLILIDRYVVTGIPASVEPSLVSCLALVAFILLFVTVLAALARDGVPQSWVGRTRA